MVRRKMEKKKRSVLTSVTETELDILKRHIYILKTLQKNEPVGIIKLSELIKYPQHLVRYSLRILEQEKLVEPSPQGAITTDAAPEVIALLKRKLKSMNETINKLIETLE